MPELAQVAGGLTQRSGPSTLSPFKILIVDDDRSLRRGLRQLILRMDGAEVIEADSLSSARSAIAEAHPDVMLLDIRLNDQPGDRSGLDLLRELNRTGQSVPTVMVTSSTELADLREAMRLGARDYVLKDELCAELLLPI